LITLKQLYSSEQIVGENVSLWTGLLLLFLIQITWNSSRRLPWTGINFQLSTFIFFKHVANKAVGLNMKREIRETIKQRYTIYNEKKLFDLDGEEK